MVPLSLECRRVLFGAAGKAVSTAAKTTTTRTRKTTTTVTKTKTPKAGSASGMLMAAGLETQTPQPPARRKTTTKAPTPKRDVIFKEINKYGMIALTGTTLINHAHNTINKMVAASHGDDQAFRFYEERAKSYLKPHFSLPSQWHQARTTFGTPWYY